MIIDDSDIRDFLATELNEISQKKFKTHTHACCHCGCPIRYESIARQQDVEDFELIMKSTNETLNELGVTGLSVELILSKIHTQIMIGLMKKGNDNVS